MSEEDLYVYFCDGSDIKNKEIIISLPPDIAFKLELLAKKSGMDINSYIISLLRDRTEELLPGNKSRYKIFFE